MVEVRGAGALGVGVEFRVEAAVARVGWDVDYFSSGCRGDGERVVGIGVGFGGFDFSEAGEGGSFGGGGGDLDGGLGGVDEGYLIRRRR